MIILVIIDTRRRPEKILHKIQNWCSIDSDRIEAYVQRTILTFIMVLKKVRYRIKEIWYIVLNILMKPFVLLRKYLRKKLHPDIPVVDISSYIKKMTE